MPVVVDKSFSTIMKEDASKKPEVMKRQNTLLEKRYDLSNRPVNGVTMSGGKSVQEGVRVKLSEGIMWEKLAEMNPEDIREQGLFPKGFLPLPQAKHETGGQVFPSAQIEAIQEHEGRSLERFDIAFDLPEQFLPTFPPPIYLSSRPD